MFNKSILHRNNVILLPAFENHVFSPFGSYAALIRLSSSQSGKFDFGQTSELRLEKRLISSNYT